MRIFITLLVVLGLLGGMFTYAQQIQKRAEQRVQNLEQQLDRLREENRQLRDELEKTRLQVGEGTEVTLYFVFSGERDFYLVPEARVVRGDDLLFEALRELAKGPESGSPLNRSLPAGTRVLDVQTTGSIAHANFSQEIVSNFNWGSSLESLMMKAIANTLTEFPQVEGIRVLVEGEVVNTIGGHLSADEVFFRDEEVIRRG